MGLVNETGGPTIGSVESLLLSEVAAQSAQSALRILRGDMKFGKGTRYVSGFRSDASVCWSLPGLVAHYGFRIAHDSCWVGGIL